MSDLKERTCQTSLHASVSESHPDSICLTLSQHCFQTEAGDSLRIRKVSQQPKGYTKNAALVNSLDQDDTPSNSAFHLDPSCLTFNSDNIFTNFERLLSTLKIEENEKFSRRQFIWRAKGSRKDVTDERYEQINAFSLLCLKGQ